MRIYAPDIADLHVYPFWKPVLAAIDAAGRPAPDCPRTLELLERSIHVDVSPLNDEQDLDEIAFAFEKVADGVLALTVRVGVVGGGLVAQAEHLPYLSSLRDRFTLAALAEPSADRPRGARRALRRSRACTRTTARCSTQAALDAVVICSPAGDPRRGGAGRARRRGSTSSSRSRCASRSPTPTRSSPRATAPGRSSRSGR